MLDETEFLSPYGVRSLSRYYKDHPYSFTVGGDQYSVGYAAGESDTRLFGGNSNWRGPVWMPINFLLVEALERYHRFYGDSFESSARPAPAICSRSARLSSELSPATHLAICPDQDRPSALCTGRYKRTIQDEHSFGIWSCSTNTSTATMAVALVPAIRPAGRAHGHLVQDHCRDESAKASQIAEIET